VLGESGTGKDLVAKAIHFGSSRADQPFIAINCAAIPATLIESELFGHEKGAFTDAKGRKEGLFEQAQGGTLFLDEIGELELGLQAKLLRVLEEGSFRRVGGLKDLPLNVRVLAASNRDLKAESDAGRFRLDLYYRLSVIQIDLPPLRERGDDVLLLAKYYLAYFNDRLRKRIRGLTPEIEGIFRRYSWPGNVRELRNVIERVMILEDSDLITADWLPRGLVRDERTDSATPVVPASQAAETVIWLHSACGWRPPSCGIFPSRLVIFPNTIGLSIARQGFLRVTNIALNPCKRALRGYATRIHIKVEEITGMAEEW